MFSRPTLSLDIRCTYGNVIGAFHLSLHSAGNAQEKPVRYWHTIKRTRTVVPTPTRKIFPLFPCRHYSAMIMAKSWAMKPCCDFVSFVSDIIFLHKIFGEYIDGSKYFFIDFFNNFETYSWLKYLFFFFETALRGSL